MKCPRFQSCSAPVCPFDPQMTERVYRNGESICIYMSEIVKPAGRLKLLMTIGGIRVNLVSQAIEWAYRSAGALSGRLEKASRTPSRLTGGRP